MRGEDRRACVERLHELEAKVAVGVLGWNAGIDEDDADATQTTHKEFREQAGLREIERQINADLAAWERDDHGVG